MFSVFQIKNELQASVFPMALAMAGMLLFKVEDSMMALAGMLLLNVEDFILVLVLAGILLFKVGDFIMVLALAGMLMFIEKGLHPGVVSDLRLTNINRCLVHELESPSLSCSLRWTGWRGS